MMPIANSPLRSAARTRRGAALMVVMVVVGVAAVLGFAMVSASALQAQTGGNLKYVSSAEYLAESGAQLAVYYLQHPSASPVAMPNGYYPGQTGVIFGSSASGSADITVTYDSTAKLYTITSIGKATLPSGGTINKTLTATAAVVTQFQQTAAVTVANDIKLPGVPFTTTKVTGEFQTNGLLSAPALGGVTIDGRARYRTISAPTSAVSAANRAPLTGSETITVPTLATIRSYTGQYTYQGRTYNAQYLSNTTLGNTTLPTASDALTNPAGIYWSDHNVQINGNVTFNGTLVITYGKLTVGSLFSFGNTFTPVTGFPALVVQSDIDITAASSSLTANGLVWTGGGLKTGLLGSSVTINGAFLSSGNAPIDNNYKGKLVFNYDATKVAVPDFSTTNAVTVGIRVASWSMN